MYRSPRPALRLAISRARLAIFALASVFLIGSAVAPALAEENGFYTFQCGCPFEWSGDWDGNGILNEDDSRDTVALANDTAVVLMHEIPIEDGSLDELVDDRSASLEDAANVEDLDDGAIENETDYILQGRSWTNADGETIVSVQYVTVWESNFLLSVEFLAPEDDFVDAWESLDDVLLIGSPILAQYEGEDLFNELIG